MHDQIKALYGNKIRVRACGICIRDNALLLVKHRGVGPKNVLWVPPGGGIVAGESAPDALIREFREETGLKATVGGFLFVNEYIEPPLHAIELFFHISSVEGKLINGSDPEMRIKDQIIEEVRFVTFREIQVMDKNILHNVLHEVRDPDSLLNMQGYFKF